MRISDWSSDVCSSDLQVGGKVRRTDGTARRDRVLVTVAQAQLEQAGVAGLETQLAEVELLVERHVVRSVIRAELRRQRIGVEHIRPRHVARQDELLGLVQTEEGQLDRKSDVAGKSV